MEIKIKEEVLPCFEELTCRIWDETIEAVKDFPKVIEVDDNFWNAEPLKDND